MLKFSQKFSYSTEWKFDVEVFTSNHASRRFPDMSLVTMIIPVLGNLLIPTSASSVFWTTNYRNPFHMKIYNGGAFVDKTLLIKEIAEDEHKIIVITRPPDWGKTMNLNMLMTFFNIEYDSSGFLIPESEKVRRKLFVGGEIALPTYAHVGGWKTLKPLKIAKYEDLMKSQGKHPVLKMTMRRPGNVRPYNDNELMLLDQLRQTFGNLQYLHEFAPNDNSTREKFNKYQSYGSFIGDTELSREELVDCLKFAVEVMYKRHNQTVYVLVDDFELPFIFENEDLQQEDVDMTMELFAEVYGRALGNNPMVEKAVFTGMLMPEDVRHKVFSRVNSSMIVSTLFDEKFSQFYGFREDEIDELFERYPSSEDNRAEVNVSCGGYNHHGLVYHPSATIDRLFNGRRSDFPGNEVDSHDTALKTPLQDQLIKDFELRLPNDLQRMYFGGGIVYPMVPITTRNIRSSFVIPSLLVNFGYLNPVAKGDGNDVLVNAPNLRSKAWLGVRIEKWVRKRLRMDVYCAALRKFLIYGEFQKFRWTWLKHTTVKDMDVLLGNGIMIGLWCGILSDTYLRHIEWVKQDDGAMFAVLYPTLFGYPVQNATIIVEYRISHDERFQDEAAECASQIDVSFYKHALERRDIKAIKKMCLVFYKRDVAAEWVEEKVQEVVENENN